MLVGTPIRELREMVEDLLRIGMEDVRPVLVNQQAGIVVAVVGVAADVRPAVDDEDALVALARETFRKHAAGKAGADDQPIVHGTTPPPSR